jgi:hypothetical protein
MNKLLLSLALIAVGLSAQAATDFTQEFAKDSTPSTQVAMGDTGSIKASLSDSDKEPVQTWAQLSDEQRKVLTPLASEWDTLRPWQREKMLDIAKDYPKMDALKQQRVQKRLASWSRMTPYERENARKRYQQFHALSDDKKDERRKESGEWDYDPDVYN